MLHLVRESLVECLNVVDEDYRGQLRELNKLNFARFNARIDTVGAQLTATLERRLGEQTRWFFVAWASLLIPIIGLWARK